MSQAPRPYSTPSRTSPPKGSVSPVGCAHGHDIGMARKADMRPACTEPSKDVLNLAKAQPMNREAKTGQAAGQDILRAAIGWRHRSATDQRLRQRTADPKNRLNRATTR